MNVMPLTPFVFSLFYRQTERKYHRTFLVYAYDGGRSPFVWERNVPARIIRRYQPDGILYDREGMITRHSKYLGDKQRIIYNSDGYNRIIFKLYNIVHRSDGPADIGVFLISGHDIRFTKMGVTEEAIIFEAYDAYHTERHYPMCGNFTALSCSVCLIKWTTERYLVGNGYRRVRQYRPDGPSQIFLRHN